MFDSSELAAELKSLQGEMSRLLNRTGEGLFDATKDGAEALADQVKTAMNDLGKTLGEQEDHLETLISERPVAALASAFALGVVVGLILRRH
jgi:ElaB/YqjD/DUF883 family membrane-anchored ribosome-binding protein